MRGWFPFTIIFNSIQNHKIICLTSFPSKKRKKDFVEKSFLKIHNWKTFNGLKIVTTQNIIIESMDDHASIHLIERFVGSYLKSFA